MFLMLEADITAMVIWHIREFLDKEKERKKRRVDHQLVMPFSRIRDSVGKLGGFLMFVGTCRTSLGLLPTFVGKGLGALALASRYRKRCPWLANLW